ncbi:MAG: ABC transporter substrate-binding protein [Bacteroidetes bacterium]|nr:ABC transporter substrate-binding protein [Bacteroidota bacterium]
MRNCYFFFFFPILLTVFGCGGDKNKVDGFFNFNLYSGITSLDPAFARTQSNIWVINQLYNGLVQMDDSLNTQACIAKSWRLSEDGKTYTFTLRGDVFFHDDKCFNGKPRSVTATDFVFSFDRIRDGKTASPGAWIFNERVKQDSGFVALNDSTFQINLVKPFPPFLRLLAMQYCSVVPREAIDFYGKDFRIHPVGTGPFKLRFYYEGEKLILEKNPTYFEKENGKQLPLLKGLSISFIESKQNEFFSFMQGDLDLVSAIDQSFKDNLLTKDGELLPKYKGKFVFQKSNFLNTEYLGFRLDTVGSPLQNKYVRQAINFAINRNKMMEYLRNNIGAPGVSGFVPPALLSGKKMMYEYNPEKARILLAKAGFDAKHPMPAIKLSTTANYLDLCIFVQKDLESVGIKASIDNVPPATLAEWKMQGKAAFFRGSWIADYPDPENYLSVFYSKNIPPSGPNYFHFKSKEFDALYVASLAETNPQKLKSLYLQMEEIIADEAPVAVLYYDETIRLIATRVKNLKGNPINLLNLKRVRIE